MYLRDCNCYKLDLKAKIFQHSIEKTLFFTYNFINFFQNLNLALQKGQFPSKSCQFSAVGILGALPKTVSEFLDPWNVGIFVANRLEHPLHWLVLFTEYITNSLIEVLIGSWFSVLIYYSYRIASSKVHIYNWFCYVLCPLMSGACLLYTSPSPRD